MVDSKRIRDWLIKAAEDLEASEILLTYHGSRSLVAFHAHQAEKKLTKLICCIKPGNLKKAIL